VTPAVLEFAAMSKDYRGLRPLRIANLTVAAAEHVALLGFDQVSAEVFINLSTGATLPDAGRISVFGRPTSAIGDSADWLSTIDRFGIVSDRAVLLDQLTVIQNLAMPFTLEIEPPPDDVRVRAESLAREVGLREAAWGRAVAELNAASRARVRLGRSIQTSSCWNTSAPRWIVTTSRRSGWTCGRSRRAAASLSSPRRQTRCSRAPSPRVC
jgi:lipoprotein-releasing system ATP-binding protein